MDSVMYALMGVEREAAPSVQTQLRIVTTVLAFGIRTEVFFRQIL